MTTINRFAATALVLVLSACPAPPEPCVEGDEPSCDGGSLPSDGCNTPEQARSSDACRLTLCQDLEGFISTVDDGGADLDFYTVTLPGDLTAQSLLTIRGGYGGVPQTAVNFSVNVLQDQPDGGVGTVASGNDRRMGAASPKNVEIIQPYSQSGVQLTVRVGDIGGVVVPRVDNRNPYKLNVCVINNPDTNEPNDTAPTALTLAANGGVQQGTASGVLATNDDKDIFSFPVATARHVVYLRISSAMTSLMPPLAYRLAYVLKDPAGGPISEGQMDNEFLQIDLSTARVAPVAGTYTVEIFGYKAPQQVSPSLGDLRLRYDVDLRVMPDLDTNEGTTGNDTPMTATPLSLALGTPTTITGRLSTVPDLEWFRLNLPARAGPAVLRFELLPAGTGGRFPPLSSIPTRQIRVAQEITTGATIQDKQVACATNPAVCPRSFTDPTTGPGQLVNALCRGQLDPPHCLLAERNEEFQITALRGQKNFVGSIPLASGVTSVLFSYADTGRGRIKYADDLPWTIRVTLEDDPDEALVRTPLALSPTPQVSRGVITHGHGRLVEFDEEALNEGRGIRGPNDYDATESDRDTHRFSYGGATGTQSWDLEWQVGHVDGGSGAAGTLALEVNFCESGMLADGGCVGGQRVIVPNYSAFSPWYVTANLGNRVVQFSRRPMGNATVIRIEPVACACLTPARVASGELRLTALAVDRVANDPIPYEIRQAIGTYPTGFTGTDGGAMTCPLGNVLGDGGSTGGCGFAR